MPVSCKTAVAAVFCIGLPAFSQQPGADQQPAPAYTLHTDVRMVLTDVTVTDVNGNVIHGLPASAFRITDDGDPQPLRSFEEHNMASTALTDMPANPRGVYSNEFLQHLPPVLNIILLDTSNLALTDQMYLSYEFKQFLKNLPEGQTFALYARNGGVTIQLQNFTSNRTLLAEAAAKATPRMLPLGFGDTPGNTALQQIASELAQVPGRKNILWFAGAPPMRLSPNPARDMQDDDDKYYLHQLYDQLEAARIAIYPIDVRGLVFNPGPHFQMQQIADATGGQSYYNNNDLAQIATHILASDNSFYTLTYNPAPFKPDHKWHKVSVSVSIPGITGYTVSYRRGYFADDAHAPAPKPPDKHPLLTADGQASALADRNSPPILFSASVLPLSAGEPGDAGEFKALKVSGTPPQNTIPYAVRYTLPAGSFTAREIDGVPTAAFDVAVLAFNQDGENIVTKGDQVFAHFLQKDLSQPLKIEQTVNLKPGDLYLYIAVWDTATGRLGTLQVPVGVPQPAKASLH